MDYRSIQDHEAGGAGFGYNGLDADDGVGGDGSNRPLLQRSFSSHSNTGPNHTFNLGEAGLATSPLTEAGSNGSDQSEQQHAGLFTLHTEKPHVLLGELAATAICGNDLTSSCLYTIGVAIASGGNWAPLGLLTVSLVLYFFRGIYTENGSALPLNGGCYTLMLNTLSKQVAAIAACLSMLAYIATAVVSASEAVSYVAYAWPSLTQSIFVITLVLLAAFALLNYFGLTESSRVAAAIFVLHNTVLAIVLAAAIVQTFRNGWKIYGENWATPAINLPNKGLFLPSLFFGYSTSMLGVTGFETSANFIEEQAPGVFPKTLRNMWWIATIFNPLLGLFALGVMPIQEILLNPITTVAMMAKYSGGDWLMYLLSVDAGLVLSGSVLTSYVGVGGLIRRMALDRCLPQILLRENSWRHTNHYIIFGFLAICSSLWILVNGDVRTLEGVYTVSFLSVMALYAFGNLVLKYKRSRLPRDYSAYVPSVVAAMLLIIVALIGALLISPEYIIYFSIYFAVALLIVAGMFLRMRILKISAKVLRISKLGGVAKALLRKVEAAMQEIQSHWIVFFTDTDNLEVLNKAILYVRENEDTNRIRFVCLYPKGEGPPKHLTDHVSMLSQAYPKMMIELFTTEGSFDPYYINKLSQQMRVPKNFMFIACPDEHMDNSLGEMGGLRVITH